MHRIGSGSLKVETEIREAYCVGRGIVDQLIGIHNETPSTHAMPPKQQIHPPLFPDKVGVRGIEKNILAGFKILPGAIGGVVVNDPSER
jgi:hypothetical protein